MITEHQTVELYFVFAFTFCKLRVYETEKEFALKILKAADVEILKEAPEMWIEVDTRLLLNLTKDALPKILVSVTQEILKKVSKEFAF